MLIKWEPKMTVGVKVIDEHHKQLIGLINTLFDAMRSDQGGSGGWGSAPAAGGVCAISF